MKCAGTALNSKLISSQKELFAPMVVEAVSNLDQQLLDLSLVRPRHAQSAFLLQFSMWRKHCTKAFATCSSRFVVKCYHKYRSAGKIHAIFFSKRFFS